jgi:hypothetical protein
MPRRVSVRQTLRGGPGPRSERAPVAVGMQAFGWPVGIRTNKTSNRRRVDCIPGPKPWLTTSALAASRAPLRTFGANLPLPKGCRHAPDVISDRSHGASGERLVRRTREADHRLVSLAENCPFPARSRQSLLL